MLRNMVSSLIEHERIVTTVPKAKEVRHLADQMVTLAKKAAVAKQEYVDKNMNDNSNSWLAHRRKAASIVRGEWNVTKLMEVLGPRYQHRQGGYTRILKLSQNRAGDNAPMAVIEYVDRPGEIRAARPPTIFQQQMAFENNAKNYSPKNGVEEVLRGVGIPPVDELVTTKEEMESIQMELDAQQEQSVDIDENSNNNAADDDDVVMEEEEEEEKVNDLESATNKSEKEDEKNT